MVKAAPQAVKGEIWYSLSHPHAVAVEKLDPRLLQGLLDRSACNAQRFSALIFKAANGLQRHAGLHRELVLEFQLSEDPGRAALGGRNLQEKTLKCVALKRNACSAVLRRSMKPIKS